MKKLYFFIFVIIFLFSCQNSELEYSCDPVINEFVTEKSAELSHLTLEELISYEINLQRAIFNSWDYRKKRDIWIEKLSIILESEPFSQSEKEHIQKVIDHLDYDYFSNENIIAEVDYRSLFANQWVNYAKNDLSWSERDLAFVVYRLYTDQYQFDSELSDLNSLNSDVTTNSEEDCNCNVTEDFCGYVDCQALDCTTKPTGCGWFWSMECDGTCY
jgi:hypothetical protein